MGLGVISLAFCNGRTGEVCLQRGTIDICGDTSSKAGSRNAVQAAMISLGSLIDKLTRRLVTPALKQRRVLRREGYEVLDNARLTIIFE